MEVTRFGHEVVALANLLPMEEGVDDLDSWMYQTVGHQGLVYQHNACESDEVEDLSCLLAYCKDRIPGLQAVCSGAIASDYQRTRVENVCARLGLVSLAPLWHQPQSTLLRRMIDGGVEAVLVKVAAAGLSVAQDLGAPLAEMEEKLHALRRKFGCNVCGEGGEYETLTLDCPAFTRGRIVLDAWEARPRGAGLLVEVLARAGATAAPAPRTLHVQSISPWAPSCIGPYAQAVAHAGLVRFAGQIGLDPGSMGVVRGGLRAQAARCLASCVAVGVAQATRLHAALLCATVFLAEGAGGQGAADPVRVVGDLLAGFLADGRSGWAEDDGTAGGAEGGVGGGPVTGPTAEGGPASAPEGRDGGRLVCASSSSSALVDEAGSMMQTCRASLSEDDKDTASARCMAQGLASPGRMAQWQVWLPAGAPLTRAGAEALATAARDGLRRSTLKESDLVWARIYAIEVGEAGVWPDVELAGAAVPVIQVARLSLARPSNGRGHALEEAGAVLELWAARGL
ncbi:hypothetical protein APUTEX25_000478 [Auxenochlorella protothecoides]|uniref:Diphthine--ammonia ligase n=1 Tax=Auxenochlorella protothecoides TaxID=3075 RepID=A0A3M7KWS6_AUXPR|nr:hypothetical protein APUTEX25_000478 [Auxenochlorella protothecoides]|eukprot:RMZ54961.1 hypothetical protein APUTEX25_000478 [Auxenochlorella protothecoides]